ncbi:DUF2127 domain-containing protein [Pseudacidovorax intermedius]|uniref:DUF2127 domain-containing protein n=1 Tax=Pseudacidovorax intermedius TaxID=433924 RepID=UPI00034B7172|nr:DUF2127 domain-containing protein [Pseudacidovorax intermedius]
MHSRSARAIRLVALIEAFKGVLAVAAASGLLLLLHKDLRTVAEHLVHHLHLNPAAHEPQVFIDFAAHLQDGRLALLSAGAAAYALVRFTEAYGLFRERAWAEWLGALSGAIYLPFEVLALVRHMHWLDVVTLAANLTVVGLMVRALWLRRRAAAPGLPLRVN